MQARRARCVRSTNADVAPKLFRSPYLIMVEGITSPRKCNRTDDRADRRPDSARHDSVAGLSEDGVDDLGLTITGPLFSFN